MDISSFKNVLLVLATNLAVFLCEVDGSLCTYYTYKYGRRRVDYMKCDMGCCGSTSRRYCCEKHSRLSAETIGWIALAIFVAVGFFVVFMCIRRRRFAQGQQRSRRQRLISEFGVLRTGNANPGYSGPPGSPIPYDQSQTSYAQLNPMTLSPPAYETVKDLPANTPPKYDSIYKT